jgi:L-alanine-DL-glutamate epimerase-like enolase superfamily enzyme
VPRIEAVDFFYLAMPVVTDEADGSQDALLVRVAAGGHVGWGECEASPLVSIAAFITSDVAWRLPAGCRFRARTGAGKPGGYRPDRRGGRI